MLPRVNGLRDLGPVKIGGSGSHFISCDDENEYIVKFADATKTVVNEYVCGSLALVLGLPVPQMSLVNLSKDLISLSPDLATRGINPGYHFGSRRLSNSTADFQHLDHDLFREHVLENVDDLYGVVAFDNWVLNADRNNTGNNMIEVLPNNRLKYYMIDFGHCFTGNSWDSNLRSRINDLNFMAIFDYITKYLKDLDKFKKWCRKISDIQNEPINKFVDSIPPFWTITGEEKNVLKELVIERRTLVETIITNNRGVFGV